MLYVRRRTDKRTAIMSYFEIQKCHKKKYLAKRGIKNLLARSLLFNH